ncbi:hypothetical protein [Actinomadura napierensis]|uniref:Uncharacterized protein n=1 Tax=Actinomadura napierensis TaxID=267854 RepID=A0ABP5M3P4_9ACTN
MAWEWVLPVASATSAAIVGVSGVIAGWMTARSQRHLQLVVHKREMAQREHSELRVARREIYARLISSLHAFADDAASLPSLLLAFQEARIIASAEVISALAAAQASVEEVHLCRRHSAEAHHTALRSLLDAEIALTESMHRELLGPPASTITHYKDKDS